MFIGSPLNGDLRESGQSGQKRKKAKSADALSPETKIANFAELSRAKLYRWSNTFRAEVA
jgi:hypothetical protein